MTDGQRADDRGQKTEDRRLRECGIRLVGAIGPTPRREGGNKGHRA